MIGRIAASHQTRLGALGVPSRRHLLVTLVGLLTRAKDELIHRLLAGGRQGPGSGAPTFRAALFMSSFLSRRWK